MSNHQWFNSCLFSTQRSAKGLVILFILWLTCVNAHAAGWTVHVRAYHIEALTNTDASGEQDLYWKAHMEATVGSGGPVDCNFENEAHDDDNSIDVNWSCDLAVTGGLN